MNFFLVLIGLTIVATAIHAKRAHGRTAELLLMYSLFFLVGISGVIGWMGHFFRPEQIAAYIGWQNNPFQREVAFANLSLGILGLMCIWKRGNFWLATVIALAVFYLGCFGGHLYEWQVNGNTHPGNIGAPLFIDILLPVYLMAMYAMIKKRA